MRKLLGVILVVLVVAAPAAAQDRPFGVNFGGGTTIPVTGLNDTFDTGWNGTIGGTYYFSPTLGFNADYMYHRMGGPDRTLTFFPTPTPQAGTSGIIESNHQVHAGTFNIIYTSPRDRGAVGAYGIGGLGIYHRLVQLTTPSVGYTTICDPYWYVCYPTLVSVDRIIGDRSSNDFGINFGAGVTFGAAAKFYVEVRYHYVWGPEVTNATTLPAGSTVTNCSGGCSTNAGYLPITFGVRW
jgi:opacity protein-like surface antigen